MSIHCELIAYHHEFRTALFISGFTIGSFLFSMKSVIIKTMKDEYYDLEEYQDAITQRRSKGSTTQYYSQLRNFSRFLTAAISLSFVSALSQVSFGYTDNIYLILICLFFAILSLVFVGSSIFLVSRNWSRALDMAEKIATKKNKEKFDQYRQGITAD